MAWVTDKSAPELPTIERKKNLCLSLLVLVHKERTLNLLVLCFKSVYTLTLYCGWRRSFNSQSRKHEYQRKNPCQTVNIEKGSLCQVKVCNKFTPDGMSCHFSCILQHVVLAAVHDAGGRLCHFSCTYQHVMHDDDVIRQYGNYQPSFRTKYRKYWPIFLNID